MTNRNAVCFSYRLLYVLIKTRVSARFTLRTRSIHSHSRAASQRSMLMYGRSPNVRMPCDINPHAFALTRSRPAPTNRETVCSILDSHCVLQKTQNAAPSSCRDVRQKAAHRDEQARPMCGLFSHCLYHIIPGAPAGMGGMGSLMLATAASVVRKLEATLVAF